MAKNGIRFYAGALLITPGGFGLDSLGVTDTQSRLPGKIEFFVQNHSDATFTRGLSPDCSEIYFPGVSPGVNRDDDKK